MTVIPVKQCTLSPGGVPRFTATVGDSVFVKFEDGPTFIALKVDAIADGFVSGQGPDGEVLQVPFERVIGVMLP